MTVPAKLAGFGACLTALFGVGALAGAVADPPGRGAAPAHDDRAMGMGGHEADPVRGLAVAEHGLRLVVDQPEFPRSRTQTLRFRVVDGRDRAVRDFDVEHTRRMHLIVARRDLTGFQHLHPRMAADGTWSI